MLAIDEAKPATKEPPVTVTETRPKLYRLRVTDYEKMIAHGIFAEDGKFELWEGVLIEMSPKGIAHTIATHLALVFFQQEFGNKAILRVQDPIRLDDFSEPEPDVVLAKPPLLKYLASHPTPADVYFVLEVADTTLARDRIKSRAYARNGIAQYLILNLNARELEDYREPAPDGYRRKQTFTADESFSLAAFPDIEIKVGELLPPQQAEEVKQGLDEGVISNE